jgi:tRNA pseudouridine38-40 synthase
VAGDAPDADLPAGAANAVRRTIRMRVAYDGSGFHGWQTQPGVRTVQGVIEEALAPVLGEPVRLQGAGRTDAGVHARGQVASFVTAARIPARALPPVLDRRLPPDVRVHEARDASPEFDARRSAVGRHYAYRLLDAPDLLLERFAWRPARPPDAEGLARAAGALLGEHDFSAFRGAGGSPVSPRCRLTRASWSRWEGGLRFDVVADHFLYHMVRVLVGTSLALSGHPDPASAMAAIRDSRDRTRAGVTVPPHGLTLEAVDYGEDNTA